MSKKDWTARMTLAPSALHQERAGSHPADSANRAGSGHGGSSESSDVRQPQGGRTKNAPEDETDLMPRSVFLFSSGCAKDPHRKQRINEEHTTAARDPRSRGKP
jgi:hypothetical protein